MKAMKAMKTIEKTMKEEEEGQVKEEIKEEGATQEQEASTPEEVKPKMAMSAVCTSSMLDSLMSSTDLKITYHVPKSTSVDFVSDRTTGMLLPSDVESKAVGIAAGLGIKRKGNGMKDSRMTMSGGPAKKPKTLSEKREALQADIMRYGLDAVEKMYPRQQQPASIPKSPMRRLSSHKGPKGSPIKMKPRPLGFDFEEVDARQILKPLSHDKYIHEPSHDSVVYIARRNGIVPLSSLCKDSKTVLSSNVRVVQGRNVRLGKPAFYIRDKGRMLALGGSRNREHDFLKVMELPKLKKTKPDSWKPFEMDLEFAKLAADALMIPKHFGRVDIRKKKKLLKAEREANRPKLNKGNILEHMLEKFKPVKEEEEESEDSGEEAKVEENSEEHKADNAEEEMVNDTEAVDAEKENMEVEGNSKEEVEAQAGEKTEEACENAEADSKEETKTADDSMETEEETDGAQTADDSIDTADETMETEDEEKATEEAEKKPEESQEDKAEEVKEAKEGEEEDKKDEDDEDSDKENAYNTIQIHQAWNSSEQRPPVNVNEIENRAIVTDKFREEFEERKKNPIAGVDVCDVEECFCKEPEELTTSAYPTEVPTPASGSQTPSATNESVGKDHERKTKSKLKKVKRALKSLGVNFYEFDVDQGGGEKKRDCSKEFCRLGCICDTIASKPVPPTHCGKVDCMFKCCCSEDAVKFANSRKVGISPAGAANLRSTLQRHMAAEERKFHNTVVASTSGQDLVMLGSSGRQKRERKVPSRYQDSNTLLMDAVGKDYVNKSDLGDIEDYTLADPTALRLMKEGLKDDTVRKCTVIVPYVELPPDVRVWCMFHCEYNCGCQRFKNPLDFAPDRNLDSKSAKKAKTDKASDKEKVVKKASLLPDAERPRPKSAKILAERMRNHSARTFGLADYQRKNKVKMPYKVVVQKVKPKPLMPEVSTAPPKKRKVSCADPKLLEDNPPFNLAIQPKGAVQYVKWNYLKQQLVDDKIKVYCFNRASRTVVFVARKGESPYVTTAEDIKSLHHSRLGSMPATVESLLSTAPPKAEEVSKFAILTHNGIAWEITGVLQKKKPPSKEPERPVERRPTPEPQQPAANPNQSPFQIAPDTRVSQLPSGQSLVTMQRPNNQAMQIKLPPTMANQHWCTIRVDNAEGSVQCPGSNMSLKCNVLKQAANLSMKEETTVRIPIAVPGEVSSFGVYAVPGLSTHVFVGPFTEKAKKKEGSSEVICLDQNDDEDIQVLGSSKELAGNKVVGGLVNKMSDTAVTVGERKKMQEAHRSRVITGQVPQVVSKSGKNEIEAITIDSDDDEEPSPATKQVDRLKEDLATKKVPYVNLPVSNHGKVVMAPEEEDDEDEITEEKVVIKFKLSEAKVIEAELRNNGTVIFVHPDISGHIVYCSSKEEAQEWVNEYKKKELQKQEAEKKKKAEGSEKKEEKFKLHLKPMSSLVANGPQGNGVIKRTQEIIHEDGSKGLAIFLNKQNHQEMAQLFYNLGIEAYESFFSKSTSQAQILAKAKEEALRLQALEKELEAKKKDLSSKRKLLFSKFTLALKDQPQEVKKQKLLELKNLIKKVPPKQEQPDNIMAPKKEAEEVKVEPKTEPDAAPDVPAQIPLLQLASQAVPSDAAAIKPPQPPPTMAPTIALPSNNVALMPPPQISGADVPGAHTPYSDVTGLKTVKKDGKVNRPMNAFMLWSQGHRKTLIANGYDGATVSKMLAEEWKVLTDEQKQQYYHEAEHIKKLHQLQHPEYKYSPRARKPNQKRPKQASSPAQLSPIAPRPIAPSPSASPGQHSPMRQLVTAAATQQQMLPPQQLGLAQQLAQTQMISQPQQIITQPQQFVSQPQQFVSQPHITQQSPQLSQPQQIITQQISTSGITLTVPPPMTTPLRIPQVATSQPIITGLMPMNNIPTLLAPVQQQQPSVQQPTVSQQLTQPGPQPPQQLLQQQEQQIIQPVIETIALDE